MLTNIEVKVKQKYDSFSATEIKIADYLVENLTTVFELPIASLAERSGVSQAAWVRFAKTLGYSGLKDLKKNLVGEYNAASTENSNIFTDIQDYENIDSLTNAIRGNSVQAIEDTNDVLDREVLNSVVQLLTEAKTIRLFGVGASATVAEDFAAKLLRIGASVCFHYDTHMQLSYAANAAKEDIALLISHSGSTKEVLEMQNIMKDNGVTTVSLTKIEGNSLARETDWQLYTSSPEIYYRSGAMSSRLAQLFVIDVLYSAMANRNYEDVSNRLQRSLESCRLHKVT